MSIYSQFATDENLETKGIWLEYDEGASFLVARAGGSNVKFKKFLEKATRPHRRAIQRGTISDEVVDKIMMQAYAKHVVLGWKNITDKKGNPIEFTEANFIKLMQDLKDLWIDIQTQAQNMALFIADVKEAEKKTSASA